MRHVPIAEFENNVSEYLAAAEAGDEIVVMKSGQEVARLTAADPVRQARKRAAVDAMFALGQEIRAKYGPTTDAEIREWLEEGRR
ncbi:MAG: type II toxin-antitoxin system prevent-host-death family antitoxin [Pseudomonadota bacterium]